jgi:hypothetical protein
MPYRNLPGRLPLPQPVKVGPNLTALWSEMVVSFGTDLLGGDQLLGAAQFSDMVPTCAEGLAVPSMGLRPPAPLMPVDGASDGEPSPSDSRTWD